MAVLHTVRLVTQHVDHLPNMIVILDTSRHLVMGGDGVVLTASGVEEPKSARVICFYFISYH